MILSESLAGRECDPKPAALVVNETDSFVTDFTACCPGKSFVCTRQSLSWPCVFRHEIARERRAKRRLDFGNLQTHTGIMVYWDGNPCQTHQNFEGERSSAWTWLRDLHRSKGLCWVYLAEVWIALAKRS